MTDRIDRIEARLGELEATNEELRLEVAARDELLGRALAQLIAGPSGDAASPGRAGSEHPQPFNRRALLAKLGGAAVAGVGLAIAQTTNDPQPAAAAPQTFTDGLIVTEDTSNAIDGRTSGGDDVAGLYAQGGGFGVRAVGTKFGVQATSGTATTFTPAHPAPSKAGLWGDSNADPGVVGTSGNNDGVRGISKEQNHSGVYAENETGGIGIYARSGSGIAVSAITSSTAKAAVDAFNPTGTAVQALSTSGTAIHAKSTDDIGLFAESTEQSGVYGTSQKGNGGTFFSFNDRSAAVYGSNVGSGTGVIGQGAIGVRADGGFIGLYGSGPIPLYLHPSVAAGGSVSGFHQVGEFYVTVEGAVFVCVRAGTDSAAGWRRLTASSENYNNAGGRNGGSLNYLSSPIRIFDTRSNVGGAGTAPMTNGTAKDITVAGVTVGDVSIPGGAVAIVGTLAVTQTGNQSGDGGYLTLYANGSPPPVGAETSSINWSTANQNLATTVTAAINLTNGRCTLKNGIVGNSSTTHAIFDAVAFVM